MNDAMQQHEHDLQVFQQELDDFVPAEVLDAHVHVAPPEAFPAGEAFNAGGVPLMSYTFDELRADLARLLPGRDCGAICFGFPYPHYNVAANNAYIAGQADHEMFFPVRLLDPQRDTPAALEEDLRSGRFVGLKPYPDFARPQDIPHATVHEMLPSWAMELAERYRLLIVLHLPRPGRLADPLNQQQVVELAQRYPQARLVLAHVGRSYYAQAIAGQLENLLPYENIYFDLAMVHNAEVMTYLFERCDSGRVLYGSDLPIAAPPGVSVEINNQYTYITPAAWELALHDPRGKLRYTAFLNEQLRAMRRAAERAGLDATQVAAVFAGNARRLLQQTAIGDKE